MKKIGFVLAVLAGICASCDKKNEEPRYSGEIILSSELKQSGPSYAYYGFSFETGMISLYSSDARPFPDLAAIHVILGESMTVDLTGSNDEDAFYKNSTFQNATEAEAYYNNYTEVIATEFQPLAQTIKENQVWTVQTGSNKFAKIWIKEITYQVGALSDYADIRIRYQYQPDGSRTFDCGCN